MTTYEITGYFRKGCYNYYVELEVSGLRWEISPDRNQLKLLGKRVHMVGTRAGHKHLRIVSITLAR